MNVFPEPFRGDRIGSDRRFPLGPGLRGGPPRSGFAVCEQCWGIGSINDVATLLLLPPVCEICGGTGQIPFRRSFPFVRR
jgi:hypothetical protein